MAFMDDTLKPAQPAETFPAHFDMYIYALLRPCNESCRDFAEFVDSLPQRDRHALAVRCLRDQVCNGGFSHPIPKSNARRLLTCTHLRLGKSGENPALSRSGNQTFVL